MQYHIALPRLRPAAALFAFGLLAGCGTDYPRAGGPVQRIAPTRVDPAFTGAATRVDPRFVARGPYAGTGVVNRGPLFGAGTGLRRY